MPAAPSRPDDRRDPGMRTGHPLTLRWHSEALPPGLTLLELAVVSAFIIIIAAIAIPSFQAFMRNARLTAAAGKIAGDIRYVQALAVNRGGLYRFHSGADPAASQPGRYRLEQSNDGGTTWSSLGPWYLLASDFSGTGMSSMTDAGSPAVPVYEVRYNSRGGCVNPGAPTYPISIVVTGQSGQLTVRVIRTGTVSLQ
jgi:Tfp pilus assembly major pilin PilA